MGVLKDVRNFFPLFASSSSKKVLKDFYYKNLIRNYT